MADDADDGADHDDDDGDARTSFSSPPPFKPCRKAADHDILHLLLTTKPPITMLHHRSKYFKLAPRSSLSCVICGPRRFYGRISFTVANWIRLR
jgi:hypothetical protein